MRRLRAGKHFEQFCVLKVSNLPHEITVDQLASVFNDYGMVQNCSRDFLPSNGEYLDTGKVKMDKKGGMLAMAGLKTSPVMGHLLQLEELAIHPRKQWIKREYEQLDEAPKSRAQWTALAKRWDAIYRKSKKTDK